ncbi:exopolysaccharide biosynthesis polyprenyl glycosylphosphotransferase [Muricomes intestini]|uniref:Exopolysaccharide biosynthesis polyprenyl glycosylphosphotransferase n=1 Tax=Muricomes intestini TaxID=1796634 RepID=A0A4V2URG6_9FIRM|nr:sugar transferase [Muricomes intestini]TCS77172.1 exopolysaccharide biosynthesis polyprenyl glycosylphosphotransferase [Muricomes intestini]
MYKKSSSGWFKHYDFIILDLICVQVAFLLSFVLRHGMTNPYIIPIYRNMAIFVELADVLVLFFFETVRNVLKRGWYKEFAITIKHVILVELFSVLYLFTVQEGEEYSRTALYLMGVLYVIIAYIVRVVWKKLIQRKMILGGDKSLIIITTQNIASAVIKKIKNNNFELFNIAGIVIVDQDMQGDNIDGIPVVANENNAATYVCREWVDEVFINVDSNYPYPQDLIDQIVETGVTVHLNLAKVSENLGSKQFVEKIGGYTVLTASMNYATSKQLVEKRLLDIIGGLFGCLLTGIIFIFVAPAIYINSPGPIFFSQIRVGKNGKKFKMYKFRSMYMDAEERKKDLMKENRIKDGKMFKVDFDTRVIGNKKLSNGEKKTGIGDFIRRTSLDEFPQFFNVLKGDMSLVGTRPPTLDEWSSYDLHHRARLSIRPGITGLWQISGRSEITDFEEVVKLDTKYISEWNMGLDLRILWKTFFSVLKQEGSM